MRTMFQYFVATILYLFILVNPLARADVKKLIESRHRPTIADIKRELTAEEIALLPIEGKLEKIDQINMIATVIAELEWAYPGAIYMPLGRDVVFTGDVIDAFYHSQGQTGRVIRLNASGPSLEVDDEMIVRWIESTGIDIQNLAKGPSYIFFDGSSYRQPPAEHYSSQSVKILNAVYHEYVRRGGQAKDLITQFSFFNLYHAGSSFPVSASLNREDVLKQQYNFLDRNPLAIPHITFSASTWGSVWSEWHGSFLLLQEQEDGSVVGPPPEEPQSLVNRVDVLKLMRLMMETVAGPNFQNLIQVRAKELGYEFKILPPCEQILKTQDSGKGKK